MDSTWLTQTNGNSGSWNTSNARSPFLSAAFRWIPILENNRLWIISKWHAVRVDCDRLKSASLSGIVPVLLLPSESLPSEREEVTSKLGTQTDPRLLGEVGDLAWDLKSAVNMWQRKSWTELNSLNQLRFDSNIFFDFKIKKVKPNTRD